jgi:hypothetical protein
VLDRDRNRAAEQRGDQIGWKKRPPSTSQASRTMDEHLRQMSERASVLDKRLRRHGEKSGDWHKKWDDPSMKG